MSVTTPGTGTYGSNGIYTGWRAEHERDLSPFITEVYLLQTRGLAFFPYKAWGNWETHWPHFSDLNANTMARKEFVRPADLSPITAESEMNSNVTSILDDLVQLSMSEIHNKHNWIDNPIGRLLEIGVQRMVRGMERLLWCSSYVRSTALGTERQTAGIGLNYTITAGPSGDPVIVPSGTGVDTASSGHWSTSITDTNYQTAYVNLGAAAPTLANANTATLAMLLKGCNPSCAFMDNVSKGYFNNFSAARERINRRPGPESRRTSHNIEVVELDTCEIDMILCLQNYPSRAVIYADLDPMKLTWGMKSGQGIQPIPQGIAGTGYEIILNAEFGYRPFHPGALYVQYNSKAT